MENQNPIPLDNVSAARSEAFESAIEVLLAGNIADDDMMWVVRLPATELFRLIQAPAKWVSALGDLPDWVAAGSKERAPRPVLTRDFAITVKKTDKPDPEGRVVVQGISGTNALTLVVNEASIVPALGAFGKVDVARAASDPFQAFWEAIAKDAGNPPTGRKKLLVNVTPEVGQFFAHFEILDPEDTLAERAARTGAFLLAAALDPEGYAAMLDRLDQSVLIVDSAGTRPGKPLRFRSASAPSLTYANIEGSSEGEDEDDSVVCGVIVGPIEGDPDREGTTGDVDGTLVKRYGIEKDSDDPADPNG